MAHKPHPFVTQVLKNHPPGKDLTHLVGYLGELEGANDDAHHKLYTGLDLRTYYHIPAKAILHVDQVDKGDANSPNRVWLASDTPAKLVVPGEVSFLSGPIASAHLAGANAAPDETPRSQDKLSCLVSQANPSGNLPCCGTPQT
jgi:hypothetical protein